MYLRGTTGILRSSMKVKGCKIGQRELWEVPVVPLEESKYVFTGKTARHKPLWAAMKTDSVACLFCWYTTSLGSSAAAVEVCQLGVQSGITAMSAAVCPLRLVYLLTLMWPDSIHTEWCYNHSSMIVEFG